MVKTMQHLDQFIRTPTDPPISFIYGGKGSAGLLSTWLKETSVEELVDGRTRHVTTYSDPETGLEVRTEAVAYRDRPAIEWVAYFKNTGDNDTPILESIQALDGSVSVGSADAVLHYSRGGIWAHCAFEPLHTAIGAGESLSLSARRTAEMAPPNAYWFPGDGLSSGHILPFFSLELQGHGLVVALGWSGQWATWWERNADGLLNLSAGMELTRLKLHPGEQIRTPLVLLLLWQGEPIDGQNAFRRIVLDHYTPKRDGKPVPCPISVYGWGSDPASRHIAKMDMAVEHNLPVDCYWVEAEWAQGPGSWTENVGTWDEREDLYPGGMREVSKAAHDRGLRFVLWFEPGRVHEGSRIWEEHPEWLRGPDIQWAGNWIFDYGNEQALDWLIDHISARISDFGVDIFRTDFCLEALATLLRMGEPADRRGINEIRYVEGWYRLWDELVRRHPGLLIDNVCGGGRMIDLETMRRSIMLWTSDLQAVPEAVYGAYQGDLPANTSAANQCHSFGSFYWLPITAVAPSNAADTYVFRSRMRSGAAHNTNYLLEEKLSKPDLFGDHIEWLARMLREVKMCQPYYEGDFYPLTDYSLDDDAWMAYQMHRPDLDEGMVMVFRRHECADSTMQFRLRGLSEGRTYLLEPLGVGPAEELGGAYLLEHGLAVELRDRPASLLVVYKAR